MKMEMLIAIKFSMCKKEKRILLVLQIALFMQNIFFIFYYFDSDIFLRFTELFLIMFPFTLFSMKINHQM